MSSETSAAQTVYIRGKEAKTGVYRAQDEVSLLRASLEGDAEAWGEIITRYKEAVFGLCLGFLRNRADAEDLTHDAFVRAYLNLRRYRLDKRFSTWLFTIASNLCRNRLRYRRYHPVVSPPDQMEGGGDPGRVVAKEGRIAKVRETLDRLPRNYRAPLVLRYYNDLSYKEIAEVLFLQEGTVKTRIHRAKLMLKEQLERDGVTQHESG